MKMNLNRMAQFHCLARKDFRYIHEHPTSGEGGYLWPFFYHRRRTESRTSAFYKSQQPAPTPCGMKSLSLSIFLSFRTRKTILGIVLKQFGG
jgi:hypothetical protein